MREEMEWVPPRSTIRPPMRSFRLVVLGAALCALSALAEDLTEVQRYLVAASRLYQNLEYERALEQLKRAKQVAHGVAEDAVIDRYEGLVLFDLGKRDEAMAAFREALYLEPDAPLPVKVSPKITEAYEATRVKVKRELAPILAKKQAEEDARKDAAEREQKAKLEAERAETSRREAAEREQKARAEAELARRRAEESQQKQLADFRRREEEARAAEARLQEARRLLQEDEKRAQQRKAELAELEARRAKDTPVKTVLVPTPGEPPVEVKAPEVRPLPVAPFVLGGATVAAGAVATVFGVMANQQLATARAANFQSDTNAALQQAQGSAVVTNVALGVAGAAAISTVIAIVVAR